MSQYIVLPKWSVIIENEYANTMQLNRPLVISSIGAFQSVKDGVALMVFMASLISDLLVLLPFG